MKIFVPPLEIGDEEGFTDEKDLFGRKDFGDGLTRLITNVDAFAHDYMFDAFMALAGQIIALAEKKKKSEVECGGRDKSLTWPMSEIVDRLILLGK